MPGETEIPQKMEVTPGVTETPQKVKILQKASGKQKEGESRKEVHLALSSFGPLQIICSKIWLKTFPGLSLPPLKLSIHLYGKIRAAFKIIKL